MPHDARRRPLPDPGIEAVLGPLGGAVMRVVWEQREATVGSVCEALNSARKRPHAYTTVMTIMSRLFERGLLERTKRGRLYVYRPASDEARMIDVLSERAVDQLLGRYGTSAMRSFAQRLQEVDPALRDQLMKLASRRKTRR